MPQPTPNQRLLGTWKSDRLRTFRHWKPLPRVTAAQHRKFKALFGHLTIRWTRKRCYTSFDDDKKGQPYEVVACDNDSLVIRMAEPAWLGSGDELFHIHFDANFDRYWMAINNSNGFVEWFRRME